MRLQTPKEIQIEKQITELENELQVLRSNKMIQCPKCKKKTRLNKATVIDKYHYVRPSGCSGGDYHTFSNEYYLYCEKCDTFNRVYIGGWDRVSWNSDEFKPEALKDPRVQLYLFIKEHHRYFGEKLKDYDEGGTITEIRERNKK
jgi:hypothetical protein